LGGAESQASEPPADYTLRIRTTPIELAPNRIVLLISYNRQFPALAAFKEGQLAGGGYYNDTMRLGASSMECSHAQSVIGRRLRSLRLRASNDWCFPGVSAGRSNPAPATPATRNDGASGNRSWLPFRFPKEFGTSGRFFKWLYL